MEVRTLLTAVGPERTPSRGAHSHGAGLAGRVVPLRAPHWNGTPFLPAFTLSARRTAPCTAHTCGGEGSSPP